MNNSLEGDNPMDGLDEPPMDDSPMPPMDNDIDSPQDDNFGMEPNDDSQMADDNEPMDNGAADDKNSEIDDIMDNLSTEDQAAVVKYAKSLTDDSESDESHDDDDMGMPMESKLYHRVIKEALDDMLDTKNSAPRGEKKMSTKARKSAKNPFVSPFK